MVRELHIHDGFPGFYRDAGIGDLYRFNIVHQLSFPEFFQAIADSVPGERGYDSRIAGVGFEIEVHMVRVF